jgi:hypothetical protein
MLAANTTDHSGRLYDLTSQGMMTGIEAWILHSDRKPTVVSPIGQLRTFSNWRWLVPLVIAASGCDLTGQYEKKFQETLKASAQQAVFDQNLHATFTDVVDKEQKPIGVKLRLPQIFDASSKADFRDTGKMMEKAGVAAPAGVPSAALYLYAESRH